MIKIFYTPPGFGNITEFLFKEAVTAAGYGINNDYSNILYLSPSPVNVKGAQKTFHNLQGGKCYIPPETATISQYCKRMYSASGDKRLIDGMLIPLILSSISGKGIGFSSAVCGLISDLKLYYPDLDTDSLKIKFEGIFHELNIPESLSRVITDSLEISGRYKLTGEENGFVDSDDVINMVEPGGKYSLLILDGFYDPTPAEKNFLKSIVRCSDKTIISVPYDNSFTALIKGYMDFLKGNFDVEEIYLKERQEAIGNRQKGEIPITYSPSPIASFVYYAYPGIEEEVEGIARNIKSLYVSGKFKRLENVVVAFPDLNKYSAMVERVFHRYGIPCDISRRTPLGKTGPFLDLLSLLDSVADGYPRLEFSQFLSSRYFGKIPDNLKKWIPALSLQSGIVSGKDAWMNFISYGSETVDISLMKERADIEKDMRWIFERLKPLDDVKSGAGLGTYADLLRRLLDDFGFMSFSPDQSMADIRRTTGETLEKLSFLGMMHPHPISLHEFINALSHILNASYADPEGTGVRIMEISEISGLASEYVYAGGLTDGDMPQRPEMDYLLPDSVKKRLGFFDLEKYIDTQRFDFYRLLRSSTNLHLSYPLMDADDMFLPSSFLYSGEEVRERIPGIFSKEEYLVMEGGISFSGHITEISAAGGRASAFMRVTDIDAYRMCPRRFFIERILNLKPMSVKEYELEAATIGIVIHKIMEKIIKEPFKGIEDLRDRAESVIDESMKDKRIDVYWKKIVKDTFMEILPDIYEMEIEIRKDGYVSTEVERTMVGEPIKDIKLKGKIDRFDKIGDSVQIIDYKTGGASLNCRQVLEGNENLQLFLYAAMMKHQGYDVSRVGIYSLKDIDIKWCPPSKRGKGQEVIDDYIIAALKFLEDAAAGIRKGDFKAKPLNDYICWNCHEYAFCPYIQQ
ncbi:MAG: PD-(D/E)XK nuclease family protein [Nitrospirae bacterium]|nr:PD-(D/E)XK nuclease family protein [Nitrospirota bacterium]MCL5977441.1 PD-(D/E)XK nuclease family protein [Nitrospirota bacterium]